ncbi:MAG: hypothetical protein MUP81_05410 [Dehalococcoidia bacterium]|nr:hypothetical protein [Dehalococcoidia bacterium]
MKRKHRGKILITETDLLRLLGYEGGELLGVRNDDFAEGIVFLISHKSLPEINFPGEAYRTFQWENDKKNG